MSSVCVDVFSMREVSWEGGDYDAFDPRGQHRVEARVGDSSYTVKVTQKGPLEVHADQLKPCIWEELDDKWLPLEFPAPKGPTGEPQ